MVVPAFRAVFAELEAVLDGDMRPPGTRRVTLTIEGEFVLRQDIRDNVMLVDSSRVRDGMVREHWDARAPCGRHGSVPGC